MRVHTDHATVAAVLDEVIAADPVRGTILGSIRMSLTDAAWLARAAGGVAARSAVQYPITLAGAWTPPELVELTALLRELPGAAGVSGEPEHVEAILATWGAPAGHRMGQRLFSLATLTEPVGVSGTARLAGGRDRDLLCAWTFAFVDEAGTGDREVETFVDRLLAIGECWLWSDPQPVSMAARRPAVEGSARIGPVYTPPADRGHGYGSAVTAAATRSILAEGAIPVLFTDLANPTSNKIYQLLGYRPVEDRVVTTFR